MDLDPRLSLEVNGQDPSSQYGGLGDSENIPLNPIPSPEVDGRVRSWATGQTVSAGYYVRPIEKKLTWKPATLKGPWLLSTAVCLLAWVGILEYVSQQSLRKGGFVFAPSPEDFTYAVTFLTSYLPTIVAVMLSVSWSWVDLDVKRLEPYFQMSKPGGASAADSVLLHYPHEFIAFAPVSALRRRYLP